MPSVMAPSPSAPTILVPAVSHSPVTSSSSTPKTCAKRAIVGGGRKGSGGSQPKQKSLMRQVSRTSLLDLHDDGTQPRSEINGLSHADVNEMLRSTIHSDDEHEMLDVKIIESSSPCEDMTAMTPAHGTFTPLRPVESPMVTPMVSPMMTPMVPPPISGPCVARPSVAGLVNPAVDIPMMGGNMVKSFSSTSLQQSPTPVHPPPSSVVASPYIKHRLDSTAGQRPGTTSPLVPQNRLVWPFDRGVQLAPSFVQSRSPTPQPPGPHVNGGSPMPNAAWSGKSASPMGRRPTKLTSSPTQVPSNAAMSCSPPGYPSGYVGVSPVSRSASVKHLAGF